MEGIKNIDIDDYTNGQTRYWKTNGFFVTDNNIHDLLRYFPVRLNSYAIAICDSGYVKTRINGAIIEYRKNTFAAFTPSSIFEILEVSDDYRCRMIVFKKEFLMQEFGNTKIFNHYSIFKSGGRNFAEFNENESLTINNLFIRIRKKMENIEHSFRESILRSQLVELVNELEHIFLSKNETYLTLQHFRGKKVYSEKFHQLLLEHLDKEHRVDFYASKLHITPKYLGVITKEVAGKSPKEIINEELIIKAKILLQSGKYNISEVANILHYDNLEVFSRFFKKNVGLSPLKFSQKQQKSS